MAEKRNYVRENLNAGQSKTYVYATAIDLGKKWTIRRMVASAESIGDDKSVTFTMQFGGAPGEFITAHVNGSAISVPLEREFEGDGVKKIRIIVTNGSSSQREISFTIDGYEL